MTRLSQSVDRATALLKDADLAVKDDVTVLGIRLLVTQPLHKSLRPLQEFPHYRDLCIRLQAEAEVTETANR